MSDRIGNGPLCPMVPQHGRTYQWTGGKFLCVHSDHGGNGKFFTDKEAHGEYELKEGDVTVIYQNAARDVAAGRVTLEQAVADIARTTKRPPTQVREAVRLMLDTINEDKKPKEHSTVPNTGKNTASRAKAAKAAAAASGGTRRLEHVEGAEFARVRDELGLTNKQAAEATGAAGMGASSTYIYIVTHQGSSADLFAKYEKALRSYAKEHKAEIKEAKAKAAVAAKAKPTAKAAAPKAAPKAAAKPVAKAAAKPAAKAKAPAPETLSELKNGKSNGKSPKAKPTGKLAAAQAKARAKAAAAPTPPADVEAEAVPEAVTV